MCQVLSSVILMLPRHHSAFLGFPIVSIKKSQYIAPFFPCCPKPLEFHLQNVKKKKKKKV